MSPPSPAPRAAPKFNNEPFSTIVVALPAGLSAARIVTIATPAIDDANVITHSAGATLHTFGTSNATPDATPHTMLIRHTVILGERKLTRAAVKLPSAEPSPNTMYTAPTVRVPIPTSVFR